MSKSVARFINNTLATIVFVLACFIAFSPFLPELQLAVSNSASAVREDSHVANDRSSNTQYFPKENALIIPAMGVHGIVHEGDTVETMNKGIWHRPHSSDPTKGGNTVLVAHRYLYTSGPDTFYHLPKVTVGQRIKLYWNKKEYVYEVVETKVVDPDAVEIEKESTEPVLTLYTCTPLWTSAKRFVVRSKLISPSI